MRVYPMFFCRKQKRKQTQLKGSFMKMNSTQIYEKFLFLLFELNADLRKIFVFIVAMSEN